MHLSETRNHTQWGAGSSNPACSLSFIASYELLHDRRGRVTMSCGRWHGRCLLPSADLGPVSSPSNSARPAEPPLPIMDHRRRYLWWRRARSKGSEIFQPRRSWFHFSFVFVCFPHVKMELHRGNQRRIACLLLGAQNSAWRGFKQVSCWILVKWNSSVWGFMFARVVKYVGFTAFCF